jgi:hypothetical protein
MSDDRELVLRALRRLAAKMREGQDAAAHPSVEDLVAYHAGELSEPEDRDLRQHLLLCRDCPDLILALDGFSKLPNGEGEPAPAGMDSAWEAVRRQLAREGWFAAGTGKVVRPRPFFLLPRNLLAAAAIVLVAGLGLLFLGLPAGARPRIVAQPQSGAVFEDLGPAVRGPVPRIKISGTAKWFTLVATPEGPPYPEYRVELRTAQAPGRLLWSGPWRPSTGSPDLFLEIPRDFLSPGEYRLDLRGFSGGRPAPEPPDERRFRLVFR